MPASVYHAVTVTGADEPGKEVNSNQWNQAHVLTLNAVGSEISGAFGNGGGVSFGLSADGKLTASAPAAAPSPVNFSAGLASGDLGSVVFSNGSGVTFGLVGSTITAAVLTNYAGLGETVGTIAGTDLALTVNTDGVSIGYPKWLTTYANDLTSGRAGVGETVGTVAGTDLGLTVNTDGVSIKHPNWLTTARSSNDAIGLNTAKTNVTWTVNSAGLSLDLGAHLTTARASNDALGLNTAKSNVTWTANSDGLSLDARGYAGTGTSATNASVTLNSNGLAISVAAPGGAVTLSHYSNHDYMVGFANWQLANNSVAFNEFTIGNYLSATRADFFIQVNSVATAANNSSAGINFSYTLGLFTVNGSSLSSVSSSTQTGFLSWSSNVTGNATGIFAMSVPLNINMSPGRYVAGFQVSTKGTGDGLTGAATTSLANTLNHVIGPTQQGVAVRAPGVASNQTSNFKIIGIHSVTTNWQSFAISEVSQIGNNFLRLDFIWRAVNALP